MHDILSVVLGGGRGAQLYPLTKLRSEPAVPVAGKYRLVDIPLSNCLNNGLNRIYVLTQFESVSLHRHIANTYKFDAFGSGFVEVLAAQQTNEAAAWYHGTADALRQNIRYVQEDGAREVLILSGDQLYRMDFRAMVRAHRESEADITIGVAPVDRERATRLGVVRLDQHGKIATFVEKPQADAQLEELRTAPELLRRHNLAVDGREYVANMGIYLFNREVLFNLLMEHAAAADLVTQVLFPRCLKTHHLEPFLFDGYWEDVGTIRSYHEAHLALAGDDPPFDFHSPEGVIFTRMRFLPASRLSGAELRQCLVSDGCTVGAGARLERCVLGVRSVVGRDAVLRDSVLLGADHYETEADRAQGLPAPGVGDGSVIERAILDKHCRVGRGVRIVNRRRVQEEEGPSHVIRDGIVVIPRGAVVPDGTEI